MSYTDVKNRSSVEDTASLVALMDELFPEAGHKPRNMADFSIAEDPVPTQDLNSIDTEASSEASIADEIAKAIHSAYQSEERISVPIYEPQETAVLNESMAYESEVAEGVEFSGKPAEEAVTDNDEAEETVEAITASKPLRRRSRKKRSRCEKKHTENPQIITQEPEKDVRHEEPAPVIQEIPANEPVAPPIEATHAPGTDYVKIGRSTVSVSPREYFASTFSGIFQRQQEALPDTGINIRAHEKRLSILTGIDRTINPVRIVIFVLMVLCIAGRRYSWMSLGFMKGMNGIYVSMVLCLAAMVLCWQSTYRALRDMVYLRFSHESYLLIATVLTFLEAFSLKNDKSLLPFLTMSWCVCGFANLMHNQANVRGLRSLITNRNRIGIRIGSKKWDGKDVIGKAPAGTAGFVRRQAEPDIWHSLHTPFLVLFLIIALVSSAYISAKIQANYLSVLVLLLDISMPISMALSSARAYNLLSQAISGKGILSGWFGIKSLSGRKSVMVYDSDVFPKGTIGHRGVKVYGKMTASQLVSYGASMVFQANIGLDDVFIKYVRDIDALLVEVTHLQVHEGGIEGRIHRSRVQLGTYQYMQLMGVDVPIKGSANGLYIAVNGQLQGLFAIKYSMVPGSIRGFHRFVRERGLSTLMVTRIFTVNPAFIEKHFKAPISRILCPKSSKRRMLSEKSTLSGGSTCGYLLRDGIGPYSRTVGGARRVYRMGFIYAAASIVLSFYLMIDTIGALSSELAVIEAPRLLLMHLILFLVVEIGARIAVKQ